MALRWKCHRSVAIQIGVCSFRKSSSDRGYSVKRSPTRVLSANQVAGKIILVAAPKVMLGSQPTNLNKGGLKQISDSSQEVLSMKIAVISVARSDYSLLLPVIKEIIKHPKLELNLVVSGSHLEERFGYTVRAIEEDGIPITERIALRIFDQTPLGTARSLGEASVAFAETYSRLNPDLILLLGDRFEMFAAGVAAVPLMIPIAHIHGGEETEGALDNQFRHALTKLSHVHFTSTEIYADRVRQMGEEPWRVHVSGAPGLDNIGTFKTVVDFETRFGVPLCSESVLVTLHPTFFGTSLSIEAQLYCLFDALTQLQRPIRFTYPNADPSGEVIIKRIEEFCNANSNARVVKNLSTDGYFTALGQVALMVGNSSSGIIEAASFRLPVVNIGSRQQGRIRAANVIDVDFDTAKITAALNRALSREFKETIKTVQNPYGDGNAAKKIISALERLPDRSALLLKRWEEYSNSSGEAFMEPVEI